MASARYNFIEPPPSDCFCPECSELLIEPLQTECGHHLCRACCERLNASGKDSCPTCREGAALRDTRPDRYFQRHVTSLKVRCEHRGRGCKWEGDLRSLQEHIDPARRSCDFVIVRCSYGCRDLVRSGAMKEHKTNRCRKRPFTCEFCGYHNAHDIVTEKHLPVCLEAPVECPNNCKTKELTRGRLQEHMDSECPLKPVDCEFASVGCTTKLPRAQMSMHLRGSMENHLLLVMKELERMRVKMGEEPAEGGVVQPQRPSPASNLLFNLPPVQFTMTNFSAHKKADDTWFSPPFYSNTNGYKMCLEVLANGDTEGSAEGTHVSVYVRLMKGHSDSELRWPFEGDIVLELLNWRENMEHVEKIVHFSEAVASQSPSAQQVTSGEHADTKGWGYDSFLPHSALPYDPATNTEYIQDDCLRLRVKTVAVYSTLPPSALPVWKDKKPVLCTFSVTEFSKRKQFNNIYYSPPFISEQGYKMCISVDANGHGGGKGTHVSVYVYLMKGERDDRLQWPFRGKVIVELLNWKEDKTHRDWTADFAKASDKVCGRVTEEGLAPSGQGTSKFIPTSSLGYDRVTNTQFLQDDCLLFRVKKVIAHSNGSSPKTASKD